MCQLRKSCLSWNANGVVNPADNYSLTGTFTGADTVSDGFIRSIDGEITDFTLNFFKNGTPLASYNFATISGDGQYNFNYEIAGNRILQDGALNTGNGFSIGDSQNSGYWLDSSNGTGLSYIGNNGSETASGGTLTATPVPFEPNASIGKGSSPSARCGALINGVEIFSKSRMSIMRRDAPHFLF